MTVDLAPVLTYGGLMLAAATLSLALIVRKDLAGAGGGRLFLAGGLGIGLIAFGIKLAVIAAIASFPAQTIAPLLDDGPRTAPPPRRPLPEPTRSLEPAPRFSSLPAHVPAPQDNPPTSAKAALGERLFHDPALSADRTVSCASCHDVREGAGADGRATALGVGGAPGRRNTPTVFNVAYQARLFWDGRATSLEQQVLGPLLNPAEMAMPSVAAVVERIAADSDYRPLFDEAFGPGSPIIIDRIAQALASFERTLITADSPYDRFVAGDEAALTVPQKRGMWLFDTLGCATCHAGPNFSGASLVGPRRPFQQLLVDRSPLAARYGLGEDKGAAGAGAKAGVWRIPSLRNVALTGPWFHNGAVSDLSEAVRIMATAQLGATLEDSPQARLWWSADNRAFASHQRRHVSPRDVADLVAFLHALSSDRLAARLRKDHH
ncbi:cytochrome-c peroxidase [Novispirillum sp. DQ9]|uniref:cytochrome-c peroxidase n=1 Tax=Novispirillum sp. DQ9 TaxID=3398612 RepID=UPI003C7A31F2